MHLKLLRYLVYKSLHFIMERVCRVSFVSQYAAKIRVHSKAALEQLLTSCTRNDAELRWPYQFFSSACFLCAD